MVEKKGGSNLENGSLYLHRKLGSRMKVLKNLKIWSLNIFKNSKNQILDNCINEKKLASEYA